MQDADKTRRRRANGQQQHPTAAPAAHARDDMSITRRRPPRLCAN